MPKIQTLRLTRKDYRAIVRRLHGQGRSWEACEKVLVNGWTMAAAGSLYGISGQAVSQVAKKVRSCLGDVRCPVCDQRLDGVEEAPLPRSPSS